MEDLRMDRLDAMRTFMRVAELESFTRAGASLGLPKASVSIAVRDLESAVGARLLQRTTRRVQLTQDGLRSEEHTSELQSRQYLVCRLLLEKKNIRDI